MKKKTRIELDGVSAGYHGREVLSGLALEVAAGETLGVFGPNGSGKTTLLGALTGLARVTAGEVRLDGRAIAPADVRARRRIGYVPQYFEVDGRFPISAREVALSACPVRRPSRRRPLEARLAALARTLEIAPLLNRPFGQLSGGEKKKVLIARALLPGPDILLLDEVFTWLDHESGRRALYFLRREQKRAGLTMLLVSHEVPVLKRLCGRVAWLEGGGIVFDGPLADFIARLEGNA